MNEQEIKQKILLLQKRLATLEAEIEPKLNEKGRFKSLLIALFRPLKLNFLRELSIRIPDPNQLRARLNSSFLSSSKNNLGQFHVDFLKDIPALEIRKMIKQQKIDLQVGFDTSHVVANIENLLEQQSKMMNKILSEQNEELRKKMNEKYQIGGKYKRGNRNYNKF